MYRPSVHKNRSVLTLGVTNSSRHKDVLINTWLGSSNGHGPTEDFLPLMQNRDHITCPSLQSFQTHSDTVSVTPIFELGFEVQIEKPSSTGFVAKLAIRRHKAPSLITPSLSPPAPERSTWSCLVSWLRRHHCIGSLLVLWSNQQTLIRHPSYEPTHTCYLALPCTMRTTHDPVVHRAPRTKPTCLSITPEITLVKTFHTCYSPITMQTKLHPKPVVLSQDKCQITQRCQPLITSAFTTHHYNLKVTQTTQHSSLNTHTQSL
jgi:hypothetical protein